MQHDDVVVVGGGLAGWAAAASAAVAGRRVRVLDPSTAGGRAATDSAHGFLLNRGAHALYEAGAGVEVLRRLGVAAPGGAPPLRGGHARRGDRIGLLPYSAGAIARTTLLSVRDRARIARLFASAGGWKPAELAGLSTNAWFDHLGLDGAPREVAAMFIRLGTYAADHDVLSADVAAGQLQLAIKGVRYVDGGWTTIVVGLRRVAESAGAVAEASRVRHVVPTTGGVEVTTDDGVIAASEVVLAAGSPQACAHLLPEVPAAWQGLGDGAYASCLDVGLDHVPDTGVLLGVDRPLYAIRHTPSAALAPPGSAVVHAMQYLRADQHLDPASSRATLEEHLRLAGTDPDRAVVARYLHRMPVVSSLATAEHGGLAGRPGSDSSGFDHVLVAGDWVGPTGHLADASLHSGETAGIHAADRAARPARVR
jgi:phytoene dehydrogenase-like protein